MTETEELEVTHRIAAAELGIIEELRWPIATLSGLLAYSYLHSWIMPTIIGVAIVFLMPYWHSKRYDETWDAFERATGTGKYARPRSEQDTE